MRMFGRSSVLLAAVLALALGCADSQERKKPAAAKTDAGPPTVAANEVALQVSGMV